MTQSVQHRYFWAGGSPGWLIPCSDSGIQASSIAGFEVPGSFTSRLGDRERESMEAGARISRARCGRAKLLGGSVPASCVPGHSKGWALALPLEGRDLGVSFDFHVTFKKVAQELGCAALQSARRPLLPHVHSGFSSSPLGPPATWK